MIEAAENSGALKPGQTVLEATSGNTGIGLAMVCAAKGYPLVLIMAEPFSVERRKLMRFLGAKVVITPAPRAGRRHDQEDGRARRCARLVHDASIRERSQPRIPLAHDRARDHRRFRRRETRLLGDWLRHRRDAQGRCASAAQGKSRDQIIVCEPEEAPLLGSKVEQARKADGTPAAPHPSFKPHPMQGWTPDFIPKLTSDAVDMKVIDRLLQIPGPEGIRCSKDLAAKEGIFVGITSGATFAGALKVAAEADKGANILCMLPDTGERYLSTPLFADVPADMTEEELKISRSTPGGQLKA